MTTKKNTNCTHILLHTCLDTVIVMKYLALLLLLLRWRLPQSKSTPFLSRSCCRLDGEPRPTLVASPLRTTKAGLWLGRPPGDALVSEDSVDECVSESAGAMATKGVNEVLWIRLLLALESSSAIQSQTPIFFFLPSHFSPEEKIIFAFWGVALFA